MDCECDYEFGQCCHICDTDGDGIEDYWSPSPPKLVPSQENKDMWETSAELDKDDNS